MKKIKNTIYDISYERLFKITRNKYTIDLSGSMSVVDNKASENYFQN